jgi:hypothetical protein
VKLLHCEDGGDGGGLGLGGSLGGGLGLGGSLGGGLGVGGCSGLGGGGGDGGLGGLGGGFGGLGEVGGGLATGAVRLATPQAEELDKARVPVVVEYVAVKSGR